MPTSLDIPNKAKKDGIKPLWFEDQHKDAKKFKKYFSSELLPGLEEYWKYYINTATRHLHWYMGLESGDRIPRVRELDGNKAENKTYSLPIVFNHSYDIVEQRVNRLARFKPTFEALPAHQEPRDVNNARLMKIILKQVARRNRMEMLLQRGDRVNAIMGMYYMVTEWNQNFGDYIDRKDKKKGKEGDVQLRLQDPRNVFPWLSNTWEHCPMLVEIHRVLHKETARKLFSVDPPKDHTKTYHTFEAGEYQRNLPDDHVIIYRVIYKPDEILTEGFCGLCYQDGTLLPQKESKRPVPKKRGRPRKSGKQTPDQMYPYSHEDFPHERLTDVDIEGTQVPFPTFTNLIQPQKHHDRIMGLKLRNLYLLSHPKVLMPKNSCKISSWANTPLFVEYSGGVPPKVVTFNTSAPEIDQTLAQVRAQMDQLGGIQPASRGAPPPGTRSGVQLMFFEEQEQQRASVDIIKRNEFIRRVYDKMKAEVGDHYPTSSKERLIREVGKNNEMLLRAITTSQLSSDFEIEIQNSAAFSESKAVRNQQVLEIMERAPDLLSKEQAADALELGQSEKVYDVATSALRKAEWENQEMRLGNEIPSPEAYEDLLVHLRMHYVEVQSIGFSRLPKAHQQIMFDHIEITEGLAEELIEKGNEQFRSELQTMRQYPMFYEKTGELTPQSLSGAAGEAGGPGGNALQGLQGLQTPNGPTEAAFPLPDGPSNEGAI